MTTLEVFPLQRELARGYASVGDEGAIFWNMDAILVTAPTFHAPIFALNANAPSNILPISVTLEVTQPPMSVSNAAVDWNIDAMLVTCAVSHFPRP